MRKILFAVMSSHHHSRQAKIMAQRMTWVPIVRQMGIDVIFFKGRLDNATTGHNPYTEPYEDEVWLDCPDDYRGIIHKVRGICDWSARMRYDITAKLDDDVYVCPRRLATLPIGPDYVGRFRSPHGHSPVWFASGFFYLLSRLSCNIVANAEYNGDWMDERFVATVLAYNKIWGHHDPHGYAVTGPQVYPDKVIAHPALNNAAIYAEYSPERLYQMHRYFEHAAPRPPYDLQPVPKIIVTEEIYRMAPTDEPPAHKVNRP